MKLDLHSDSEIIKWISQFGFDYEGVPGTYVGIRDENDKLIGAYVFTGYTGIDVELHIFGRGAVRRSLFHFVFHYLVDELNIQRVTVKQPSRNTRARKLAEHFGFKEEGRQRKYYGDDDAILLGLLREEYDGKYS